MIKIYYSDISKLPFPTEEDINLLTNVRRDYLLNITDNFKKKQSFYVWKLLEFQLKKEFDVLDFEYDSKGFFKLKENFVNFSLSHSENIVVVAISLDKVGVDVQILRQDILTTKKLFSDKIQNENNLNVKFLTKLWVERESFIKYKSIYNETPNDYFFNCIEIKDCWDNKYCLGFISEKENDVEYKKINL